MMKVMFAPWRMQYIEGEKPKGCVLCEAVAKGEGREALVLYVGKHAFVMMNRYPYTSGHLMIVPKRHVGSIELLPKEEYHELADLVQLSTKVLKKAFNPQGINIGMNLGAAAGAGITEHCHVHILPRWTGDTNFMSVIGDVRVIPQGLYDTFDKLYRLFKEEA